ncbi:phage lysozyme-like predicted toxin [Kushneria sinocarnis]|uniref:Phage lysozyme-like predicted toxin n=1 Tax=Kushneria sinocarnis TaxID=595502 RepID=A0A420WVW5_9GAMM|nr:pesticin C-terminus-like muramidase [Kushneria sinocarnis]RKR03254.1 phage lysozyme-like predicted toxin [Kushneria sinocarnis]
MTVISPLNTIDLAFLRAPEQGGATGAAVPEARGHRGGVIVANGVDLGRIDRAHFDSLGLDEALARKLRPYLELTGSEAMALLSAGPLRLSHDQIRELDATVHGPLAVELSTRFERASQLQWHELPRSMATLLMQEALCTNVPLEQSRPQLWQAAITGEQSAMLSVLRECEEVEAERAGRAAEYLEQALVGSGAAAH